MDIIADLHTHTIASTHAYATAGEMIKAAEEKGLRAIALTDHGPATPDSPHIYHFMNIEALPRKIGNVTVLGGIEANILDDSGVTDIDEYPRVMKSLDIIIASMHHPVMSFDMGKDYYTRAWLGVIKNPYIDILGHMDDGRFMFDTDKVIKAAAENGKIVEINNNSHKIRPGAAENCAEIVSKCKKYGCSMCINSDAHFSTAVGGHSAVDGIVEQLGIAKEMIINSSVENLSEFLNNRENKNKIDF